MERYQSHDDDTGVFNNTFTGEKKQLGNTFTDETFLSER